MEKNLLELSQENPAIQIPDLDNLDPWLDKYAKPSISFAHQSEDQQAANMKKQLKLFAEGQRSMGVPDNEIVQTLLESVSLE